MRGLQTCSWGFIAWGALVLTACEGGREPSDSGAASVEQAEPTPEGGWPEPREDAACAYEAPPPAREAHWIAYLELGALRLIDLADSDSRPETIGELADIVSLAPGWSADGRWFGFTYVDDGSALHVLEVMGAELRPARELLRDEPGQVRFGDVRWSPTGAWLAYVEHAIGDAAPRSKLMLRDMNEDAAIMALEGADLQQLRWSPDGKSLALVDYESDARFLVRLGGDGPVTSSYLLPFASGNWPVWSPDSRFFVAFDDLLNVYDTGSDPVRMIERGDATPRTFSAAAWSDDSRYLATQRYAENDVVVIEVLDTHDLEGQAQRFVVIATQGAAFALGGDPDILRPEHFAFAPGEHAIVAAFEEGWTYVPLRAELGAQRVLAPRDARIVGFGAERELLWIDASAIHATSFDGGDARTVLALEETVVRDEHAWNLGQNISVAPSRAWLAVSRPAASSAFDLVPIDGCEPRRVTFELPYRWSGFFTPHQYPWRWLRDGSLIQPTESADHAESIEGALHSARLEHLRIEASHVQLRTLLEAPIAAQVLPFEWREQP